jgi:hypothetical protein
MNIVYYFILLRDYNILCVRMCVYTHTYTHISLCMHVSVYVCVYIYIYIYIYICVCVCVCVCAYNCVSHSKLDQVDRVSWKFVWTTYITCLQDAKVCSSAYKLNLFFNQPNTHSETKPLNLKNRGCDIKMILGSVVSELLTNMKAVFKFSWWRSLTQKITNFGLPLQIFTKYRGMNCFFQTDKWLYLIVASKLDLFYRV